MAATKGKSHQADAEKFRSPTRTITKVAQLDFRLPAPSVERNYLFLSGMDSTCDFLERHYYVGRTDKARLPKTRRDLPQHSDDGIISQKGNVAAERHIK